MIDNVNIIIVYNKSADAVLMCCRQKEPYKGLYNFVGGKKEYDESWLESAYRELYEETGISKNDIELVHLMDFLYSFQDCELQVFVGRLSKDVELIKEKHPLVWMPIEGTDFFSMKRFAGEGNIGHMLEQAKMSFL